MENKEKIRHVYKALDHIADRTMDSNDDAYNVAMQTIRYMKSEFQFLKNEDLWNETVTSISRLNDPLLLSIFNAMEFQELDTQVNKIFVFLPRNYEFFLDWIRDNKANWNPHIQCQFNSHPDLCISFRLGEPDGN